VVKDLELRNSKDSPQSSRRTAAENVEKSFVFFFGKPPQRDLGALSGFRFSENQAKR